MLTSWQLDFHFVIIYNLCYDFTPTKSYKFYNTPTTDEHFMNLEEYLHLKTKIFTHQESDESLRAFGLEHKNLHHKEVSLLQQWSKTSSHTQENTPSWSRGVIVLLSLLSLFFGLLSAQALLSYDGTEVVNVLLFLALSVALPLVGLVWFVVALLYTPSSKFSLSAILLFLFSKINKFQNYTHLEPYVMQSFLLFISQLLALMFSLGFLTTFLLIVSTQDIAFGWSSTLNLSPQEMTHILQPISSVWSWLCPQENSLETLIQQSRYFRLHDTPHTQLNPQILGQWWHFLACSALFYSVFVRLITLAISFVKLQKTLKSTLLQHPQTQKVLRGMKEVLVQTQAHQTEPLHHTPKHHPHTPAPQTRNTTFLYTFGWAIEESKGGVILESLGYTTQHFFSVGGAKSLQEDEEALQKAHNQTLILIQAWEVPTMEFIDFLDELLCFTKEVTIHLIGYHTHNYKASEKDATIWQEKLLLEGFKDLKVVV